MRDAKLYEVSIAAVPTEATHVQGRITRWLLQKVDFPDGCDINTSIIEVQAGTSADRHTHPGVEVGYVLGGEFTLVIEGRADQHLKPGSSYAIPAGAIHYAKVPGPESLKVLCFFVHDKAKPLASVEGPAPPP